MIDTEHLYNFGQGVITKLNFLSDEGLKLQLKNILVNFIGGLDKNISSLLESDTLDIKRTILNGKVSEITLNFYDEIQITPLGIFYKAENGRETENLISFYRAAAINSFL